MGAHLSGQDAVQRRLERITGLFGTRLQAALYKRAEHVMTRAKTEFVPVDLGTLMNSGFVLPPKRTGHKVSVTMGFGGAASAYALAIHEHPSPHDPPSWRGRPVAFHPAGRGPKFLERPLMQAAATLARDLADDLKMEGI